MNEFARVSRDNKLFCFPGTDVESNVGTNNICGELSLSWNRHIADSGRRFGAENNRETEAMAARFPVTHNSIHYLIHDFTTLLFEALQTLRNYN